MLIIRILTIFMVGKLLNIFKQIEDNKRDLSKLHDLNDILIMALIAVICGADTWDNIDSQHFEQCFKE